MGSCIFIYWRNSSDFPGASLINSLIYDHADAPFTLQNLYQNLPNSSTLNRSYIIISNDYQSSAVILDENYFVVPVSGNKIVGFSLYFLNSFFPYGYVIKPMPPGYLRQKISMNLRSAYLNSTSFCKLSSVNLEYNKNISLYDMNAHWQLQIQCKDSQIQIWLQGYIDFFDKIFQKGTVQLKYAMGNFGYGSDYTIIPDEYYAKIIFQNEGTYINLTANATINVNGNNQAIVLNADNRQGDFQE